MFNNKELPELEFVELFKIRKVEKQCNNFNTTFRVVYPGPFEKGEDEVSEHFFKKLEDIYAELDSDDHNYTYMTVLILKEYRRK